MLFDTRYFEQLLNERILKKGLKLFESGKVEFIGKQLANEFQFIVDSTFTFHLKKKADRLMSYTCTCDKEAYCEHLAAVLFYFQQDTLGLSVKKQARKKTGTALTKKVGDAPLKTAFQTYVEDLKLFLKPYFKTKALNQLQLDKIYKTVLGLASQAKKTKQVYDLQLALAVVLPSVFDLRLLGNETKIRELLKENLAALKISFDPGLSETQQETWYAATLESVRNNAVLRSDVFLFLVPRSVTFLKSRQRLEKLKALLDSRKYKLNYATRFDKLLIARLEVAVKAAKVLKLSSPSVPHVPHVELIIAKTELDFCSHKITTAFNRLALNHDLIKQDYPFYYSPYLEYIIDNAREKNKPHIELNYLKKSFIYNTHILPVHFKRFMALIGNDDPAPMINEVIAWLKNTPSEFVPDKITDLLFMTGRLDELIDEIRKQHNKFSLLHKVLMQKLPYYDADTLALYMEELLAAFTESGYYHFQQHTFDKAKLYLDQLPEMMRSNFMYELLDRLGRSKPISRYIQSVISNLYY
jgi:hypothetical protein